MIKGVIFDLGSTLIYFDGDWGQAWEEALEELRSALHDAGIEDAPDEITAEFARRMEAYRHARLDDYQERSTANVLNEALRAAGKSAPDDGKIASTLERMYARTELYWKPVPGVKDVLRQLESQGLRMALLSNAGDEENVQRLIDRAGIRRHLDPILISAALGVRKPSPQPYELILSQWNLEPEQAVMVGDRLDQDILGAQRVGMHQIWLRAYAEPDQHSSSEAEMTGETLADVPLLIEHLNSKG
ncbi:MAG: HAD family hydrolase [Anaerolineales bacterium]|jgi:2-haloalkanoic acid dehalogenase type II